MEREPQNDENSEDRNGDVQCPMMLEGRKAVVIYRHQPGQAYTRLITAREVEILGSLRNCVGCRAPRLESTEIEDWLDLDKAAQFLRLCRFAASQDAPRKAG